ncbi:MAG: SpoIIE family protein phosphatase [Candidatus Cloacimonadota bacterium]
MPNSNQPSSLSSQIAIYVNVFILLTSVTLIIATRLLMTGVMEENASILVDSITNENITRTEAKLSKVESIGRNVRFLFQNSVGTDAQRIDIITTLLKTGSEISSIALAYDPALKKYPDATIYYLENGTVKTTKLNPEVYPYTDWYNLATRTGTPIWTEPWFQRDGLRQIVTSHTISLQENGKTVGVLRFDLTINRLREMIKVDNLKNNARLFMISKAGSFVVHTDDSLSMNYSIFALAEEYNDPILRETGQRMLRGERGFIKLEENSPLQNYWLAYAPLRSNDWAIGVLLPEKEIFKTLNSITLIQALTSIFAFVCLALIVYFKIRRINKPLKELVQAAEELGAGNFDVQAPEAHDYAEILQLSHSFNSMKESLRDYIRNLSVTTAEKNKIQTEVGFASTIQKNLIPPNRDHGLFHNSIKAYGVLNPAGDIGGDLYDYFLIDDSTFCFAIADVTGKGIVASMTMTMVSTFIRAKASYHKGPGSLMKDMNEYLCANNIAENFVTIIVGYLDLHSGKLLYANAGHVPWFIRKKDCSYLKQGDTQSTALGFMPNLKITDAELSLDLGDEIILFTDGITEAMSTNENFFGIERLEEIVKDLQNPNPETTAKAILTATQKFSNPDQQYDDITLLVIEFVHPILV